MAGHPVVPAVDRAAGHASRAAGHRLLRGDMGFTGVVVTDALEMAGASPARYGIAGRRGAGAGRRRRPALPGRRGRRRADARRRPGRYRRSGASRRSADIDRLRDAAARVRTLARRRRVPARRRPSTAPADPVAAAAAGDRRAAARRCPRPVLVLRCDEATNLAVGDHPVGVWPRPARRHRSRDRRSVDGDPLPADDISCGRHGSRAHPGPSSAPLDDRACCDIRRLRPSAVLVEMGNARIDAAMAAGHRQPRGERGQRPRRC